MLVRRAIVMLLAFLGASCSAQREEDTAACHLEALRLYSADVQANAANIDGYIKLCMITKGYRFDASLRKADDPFLDALCYRRHSPFSN